MRAKRILLLCATERGTVFAQRLFALCPGAEFTVVSFRPEPWEPDFLPRLQDVVVNHGARLVLAKRVDLGSLYTDGIYDLLLAVSWRYLVAKDIWSRARLGAYVFHDSLLPKYRGFAPTVWAIINGEPATGVSLIEMADAVDAGRLIDQERVEIGPTEFIGSVMQRVTAAYLHVLERTIPRLLAGKASGVEQNEAEATFCCKRTSADNRIDWQKPAARIFNLIRASAAPYPGAFCAWNERRVVIWSCLPATGSPAYVGRTPGRVVEILPGQGVRVLAGEGSLIVCDIQLDDGAKTTADRVITSLAATLT
jgi:methionyl-tRNA formyltransferase